MPPTQPRFALPVTLKNRSLWRLALHACLAAALCAAFWASPAQAFRLTPIETEFTPSGRGATQIFRLENDRSEPAAIEIGIMARAMTPDGADELSPADELFAIYPDQLVLLPGQSQSVRVQWTGEPAPARELPFRLIAEQLPVDLGGTPPQGGQVRLLVRYVASLYVKPPGVASKLAVTSVGPRNSPDGKRLELTVANNGGAHQILTNPAITVRAGGRTVTLTGAGVQGLAGENVLAGVARRFTLPWPAELPDAPATAVIAIGP